MTGDPWLAAVAARLRTATLAAWRDHPARFREDANAEEDHGAGWYRDRVVVELAQNAADAAREPGALLLRLAPERRLLVAANTGVPLDAAGLTSLASLRASAKSAEHPSAVGRFGVGFAAVRAVADEVAVVSRTGAVHFSAARTAAELGGVPALVEEVGRRGSALPILRLPFDGPGPELADADLPPVDGRASATAVWLRLRDDAAVAAVAAQLADLDDALLLALPRLGAVHIEVDGRRRTLTDVAARWLVVAASGAHDPALVARRPVEERERRGWRLAWAVPRHAADRVAPVVHAPTPTDDPTSIPALLLGTFPLDPGRRRITPGPVTDALVTEAGRLWPELLLAARRATERGEPAPTPLDLVPTGFPAGPLDAALRAAVLSATRRTPVLPTAAGWVSPVEAVVLAPPWDATGAPAVLGRWFAHLATVPRRELVRSLDVVTVGLGELVEQIPVADPDLLRDVYALLEGADRAALDELGAAPVPLRDGRIVHGARGVVLVDALPPGTEVALDALVSWGLRVVHPDAAHPVLERLGAQRVDAAALATHPLLRDRVLDGDEGAAEVLCPLVAASPGLVGPSWWGEVLLPAADGELSPARGLVLPGSAAAAVLDPAVLPPVSVDAVRRWGSTLERVGVRRELVVERVDELVADVVEDWSDYLVETGAADDGELLAVADLDAVRDWDRALVQIVRHPELLRGVPDQDGAPVPSYVAWRLRDEPAVCPGTAFALPGSDRSSGVLAHLPGPGPALSRLPAGATAMAVALGGIASADELTAADWLVLLDELDERGEVPLDWAVDFWRGAARLVAAGAADDLVDAGLLPGWDGRRAVALPAEELAVADPMWRRHPGVLPVLPVGFTLPGAGVPAADAVAEVLDLDVAAARAEGKVGAAGEDRPVPAAVRGLVPRLPDRYRRHGRLAVDGHPVGWWLADGVLHATGDGLAEGLAAVTDWRFRHALAAALAGAARQEVLLDLATMG
ncbi:ATP-binding protein [Isoptericola sp. b441]|uniref:ATP-binding protein n=1 Tax=Actinotalea lenta TaxID=3064654 RepID=A0ABT9D751_9CELL|nr:ATP-binding protein [Isoptericola sp. b441]MDO8106666.1 ATP-binding protein [Isoptericola sp. b441]